MRIIFALALSLSAGSAFAFWHNGGGNILMNGSGDLLTNANGDLLTK